MTAQVLRIMDTKHQEWSIKEKLCLISSIARYGYQNWTMARILLSDICRHEFGRDSDFYDSEAFSRQYANMLEDFQYAKGANSFRLGETVENTIVRTLTRDRINELMQSISQTVTKLTLLDKIEEEIFTEKISSFLAEFDLRINDNNLLGALFSKICETAHPRPKYSEAEKPFIKPLKSQTDNTDLNSSKEPLRRVRIPMFYETPEESISTSHSPTVYGDAKDNFNIRYSTNPFEIKHVHSRVLGQKTKNAVLKSKSLQKAEKPKSSVEESTQKNTPISDQMTFHIRTRQGARNSAVFPILTNKGNWSQSSEDERSFTRKTSAAVARSSVSSNVSKSSVSSDSVFERTRRRKSHVFLLKQVSLLRHAHAFLNPVPEKFSSYFEIVKYPRELKTLIKEADSGGIENINLLYRDILIMFQNALMYNRSDTDIYAMACSMFDDAFNKIAEHLKSFENQPSP